MLNLYYKIMMPKKKKSNYFWFWLKDLKICYPEKWQKKLSETGIQHFRGCSYELICLSREIEGRLFFLSKYFQELDDKISQKNILGVSEKLISFCNLKTWPIFI